MVQCNKKEAKKKKKENEKIIALPNVHILKLHNL